MSNVVVADTPVMKQFLDIKSKYDDTILLFRMGDFYETFLDDAVVTSQVLGIVLTKRANGKAADVNLAGFPHHSLDNYLPKLVKAGYRVAICEQMEDPKASKGIVKRDVVEVVTPGTLIADKTLTDKSNRYIGSMFFKNNIIGVAFLDSSTGEFHIGQCEKENISNLLLKFSPQEVVLSNRVVYSDSLWYREYKPFITQIDDWLFDFENAYRVLISHFKIKSLKNFGCDEMHYGISAAGALANHINKNLSTSIHHISKLSPIVEEGFMVLDSFTIKNLELFHSLSSQGTHGTLIDCIDMTKTSGGGRLLRKNLISPLLDVNLLKIRLDTVEAFVENPAILESTRNDLQNTADIQRILGKINKDKASPRDLYILGDTLEKIPIWQKILKGSKNSILISFSNSFLDTSKLFEKIKCVISKNTPALLSNGNVINKGVNTELDELREIVLNGKKWLESFQDSLRKDLDIPKLKIGYNKIFGFYIEVTKSHQEKIPNSFIRKQTLTNSERYITEDLKNYEEKVLDAEQNIYSIESKIFSDICIEIMNHIVKLQKNAFAINYLDFYSSLAFLAIKNNYVKPVLSNNSILNISDGRHPVVENLLPLTEKFIPNNTFIDSSNNQIHLLTGPNMAGKSTYLRQIGLIVIMAQIGSYVPASKVNMGIVDRLFTRVGASDNLAGGESTFLVEMIEASNILNNATKKSLILLDEIGRGTSTYDGLSLAWAITEYIHNEPSLRARTIFATHYHELTDLEDKLERLENHYVQVKEYKETIVFLRSIAKGVGNRSYGIHVGKMAGLPNAVIDRANQILHSYMINSAEKKNQVTHEMKKGLIKDYELTKSLLKEIDLIDINNTTPLQALEILTKLKKRNGL
ncbi:MAG: DNA mismatch repair protein MutS [Candidatus Neomarinimicrobiota bacterium]